MMASGPGTSTDAHPPTSVITKDNQFKYELFGIKSPELKDNEEVTYLNMGMPYKLTLMKLGDRKKINCEKKLKSVVSLRFHECKEQSTNWPELPEGRRKIDFDPNLKPNFVSELSNLDDFSFDFLWPPTRTATLHIKVNLCSTDFEPKRNFRIQVDTYKQVNKDNWYLLHTAYCQIQVFKEPEAENVRNKEIEKLINSLQEAFKKLSTESTVLIDELVTSESVPSSPSPPPQLSPDAKGALQSSNGEPSADNQLQVDNMINEFQTSLSLEVPDSYLVTQGDLISTATPEQLTTWLQDNRFAAYLDTFASYSGAELMRLPRDDLIELCGKTDGIRLYYALHPST